MDVYFLVGSQKIRGEIVVDSGAAECVMPKGMLSALPSLSPKAGIRFAAANGDEMGKSGRRIVYFVPVESADFSRQA